MAAKLDLEKARSKSLSTNHPYIDALDWHIDEDIDTPLEDTPVDRRISSLPDVPVMAAMPAAGTGAGAGAAGAGTPVRVNPVTSGAFAAQKAQAAEVARACQTLDELKAAIAAFDLLEIKRTATQMVFSSGHVGARVMVIGEAPGADDDRSGVAFAGVEGQLLDKMFACIGLNRQADMAKGAIYISNILNWRPPGGRTPTEAELALSLPFIERHIALARPDFVVLMGTDTGKTLLNTTVPMSRMRGKMHSYTPLTPNIQEGLEPCLPQILVTYHPEYLLATPVQKRASWQDLLMLETHLTEKE